MTLPEIKQTFLTSINECKTLYRHCLLPVGIHSDSGVEAAFLQMYNSWELFLEEILVSIIQGENVISGDIISPKFSFPDRNLIKEVIYQDKKYLEWTQDDIVKNRFKRHLNTPNRINTTLDTITVAFRDIIKIRNFIAHSSSQAKSNFELLVQSRIGGNPNTSRASYFLNSPHPNTSTTTFFDFYIDTLESAAILITG